MARRHAHHPSGTDQDGRYDPTKDPNSDYYIDRGDVSDTSTQVHDNAEQTADHQEDGDNWLEQIINIFTRQGRVDSAYNQELSQQAAELADGVNTRQPPTIAPANYMSNPHPELQRMVTEGVDPDQVGKMGDTWIEAGNAMTRFQSGVASAINNSEADWEGQAGNSARTFMAGVGNWVGNAGQSAQLAGTQTNIQASALAEAKRSMPEPVEFDVAAANRDLQTTTNPIDAMRKYTTYMAQYNAQQNAHEQAARVVTTYDGSLAGASTMPAFAQPPQMNGGTGTTPVGSDQLRTLSSDPSLNPNGTNGTGGTGGTGGPGGPGGTAVPPGTGGGGTGGGGGGGGTGGGPGGTGGGFIPGGGGGTGGGGGGTGGGGTGGGGTGGGIPLPGGGGTGTGGGTDPSGTGGFPGGIPGGTGGNGPGGIGPGGVPIPGGSGPGGANGGIPGAGAFPIGAGGIPGGGDFERGAGRFPGANGGRFGPGGFGTPGSSGFGGGSGSGGGSGGGFGSGSGAGGARGGGLGPGGMGGAGGGALAAESAAMRGGAGVAGRGGAGGMGAVPGGRGQGDEDDEHQRPSFLVEGDPDAVFGTDESTAPPVIGE